MSDMILRYGAILLIFSIVACGGKKKSPEPLSSANFLPERVEKIGAERTSDIRTFVGDSLYAYIDGGAEIYHSYNFIEVATADYKADDIDMTADIYRFDTADHAYGLYASNRPDNPDIVQLGAEGFQSESSIDFVKNVYVVRIVAFSQSDRTGEAMVGLAAAIDTRLPGDNSLPSTFALFPDKDAIPYTDMMYAKSFLGFQFLTDVFARKYVVEEDTVTLFVTEDGPGDKFTGWYETGALDGSTQPAEQDIVFDEGRVFIAENSYYGQIIAGLKSGRLVGMINYDDSKKAFLTEWLLFLP